MHGSFTIRAGGLDGGIPEDFGQDGGLIDLLRSRQEERRGQGQALQFSWQLLNAASAKDDAAWVGIVLEGVHSYQRKQFKAVPLATGNGSEDVHLASKHALEQKDNGLKQMYEAIARIAMTKHSRAAIRKSLRTGAA